MVNVRNRLPEDSDAGILNHSEALHITAHRTVEGVLSVTWQLHGNVVEDDGTPGEDSAAFARRLFQQFTKGGA